MTPEIHSPFSLPFPLLALSQRFFRGAACVLKTTCSFNVFCFRVHSSTYIFFQVETSLRICNNVPFTVKVTSGKMGETTEEKKFTVYEWTIENFSYYKDWFHGTHLQSEPPSIMVDMVQFSFYSAAVTFSYMGVKISNLPGRVKGDFSFICSDGSLLWTRPVDNEDDDEDVLYFGATPLNFCDVVALIRKNEAVHGDRLTLRLRFENKDRSVYHSMHSMIEVRTMSMKISLLSILNSVPAFSTPDLKYHRVITAEYALNDGSRKKIKMRIKELPSSKILLMLGTDVTTDYFNETTFFRTCMSVLHNDGSVIRTEENEKVTSQDETWTFSDSLTRNEVLEAELSILLQLTVLPRKALRPLYTVSSPFGSEVTTNDRASSNEPEHAVSVLLKEFLSLHQNEDFSDLQLHCEGVSFPAHKSILSARSPVFKTMLSSGMKEAASGSVDIVDLDAPTLARFLTFLYSGSVNDMQSEGALKLYYAADKYQVPTLKTACVNCLSADLTTDTVCDVLSLADKHRDDRLVAAAHSFISKNYSEVLKSEGWENLMKMNSSLALKTLTDFGRWEYVKGAEDAEN